MHITENEFLDLLKERECDLIKLIEKKEHENQKIKPIKNGKILVKKHGGGYQYYLRSDPKDTCGKYVKRKQEKMVRDILQEEYNETIIKAAKKERKILEEYLWKCPPTAIHELYEKMHDGRKRMINPVELSDEEYVRQWEQVEYEGKYFLDDIPEYYTQKGERVRSKSEVIIANLLNKYHVPYRYEFPITIKGMGTVYPDFLTLNVRKRKEIYFEHLGLLDDFEYREKAIRKISQYEMNHITLGDNLILTYESSKTPLNTQLVERKIQEMLL